MRKLSNTHYVLITTVMIILSCLLVLVCTNRTINANQNIALAQEIVAEEQTIHDIEMPSINLLSKEKSEHNLDDIPISSLSNVKLIPNSDYFLKNPKHANNLPSDNKYGTCTTVAFQLLMGYHNYYSDRRLIPEISKDGERFLCADYGNIDSHPKINKSRDRAGLGLASIGTEDPFFYEIFDLTVAADFPGLGQSIVSVKDGAVRFVEKHAPSIKDNVKIKYEVYTESNAKDEINSGRPTILGFEPVFSAADSFHVVVAYGYATYNGTDGFIVHYGHWGDKTQIWVPESYFGYQATMTVNHTHSLVYNEEDIRDDGYFVAHCAECGYSEPFPMYDINEQGIITSLKYDIPWEFTIPTTLYGTTVTGIGNAAFADHTELSAINIPSTVKTIGANAFQGCTSLNSITFEEGSLLTTIGNGAFYGCSALFNVTLPEYVTAIGANTFENCMALGTVHFHENSRLASIGNSAFSGSNLLLSMIIPAGVKTIGANAYQNAALGTLSFESGGQLTSIGNAAFAGCDVMTYMTLPSGLESIGYDAFSGCAELASIVVPDNVTSIGGNAFAGCTNLTIYTEYDNPPAGWIGGWNSLNRPIVLGCTLLDDGAVVSFTKTDSNPFNANATGGVMNPSRSGYSFGGWYTTADFSGTKYDDIASAPNGTLYAKWNENACVAAGTLITLADGTQVPVESLTGNEMLLVWNLFTGEFDVAPILFIDSEVAGMYEVVTLAFSDGTTLKVIDEHALWDFDLNEYVFMRSDAAKYIGHWFNKQTYDADGNMIYTRVQLTGVTVTTEYTSAWSPVTYGHLCFYVNGMLSMPGATTGLINIFDVDPDTMTIDEEQYLADIAQYGLFTYDEFAALYPVPEEIFDAFGGQYLKVAMGKGILTEEMISALIVKYSEFF